MPSCHQGIFMKTDIIKKHHFSLNNITADHELLYICYNEKLKFLNSNLTIAIYLSGGESEKRNIEVIKSRWRHVRNITPSLKIDLYYFCYIPMQQIRSLLKKYLPKPVKNKIIRLKNYNKTIVRVD